MLPGSMASGSGSPGPVESQGYDWWCEENYSKWRGIVIATFVVIVLGAVYKTRFPKLVLECILKLDAY